MQVDGHDDYFIVLPHGGGQAEHEPAASAAVRPERAAPAPEGSGGLLAAMQSVLPGGCPEAGRPLSGAGCAAAVNGRDDYCVVLPHGGGQAEHDPAASAAALAKVAALPKASQDAGGLRAAMQFVFARAVAALTQGGL